jgi:hypothetical protein
MENELIIEDVLYDGAISITSKQEFVLFNYAQLGYKKGMSIPNYQGVGKYLLLSLADLNDTRLMVNVFLDFSINKAECNRFIESVKFDLEDINRVLDAMNNRSNSKDKEYKLVTIDNLTPLAEDQQ